MIVAAIWLESEEIMQLWGWGETVWPLRHSTYYSCKSGKPETLFPRLPSWWLLPPSLSNIQTISHQLFSNSKCLGSRINCPCLASSFHMDVFARQDFILRSVKAIFLQCPVSSLATEVPVIWKKLQNHRKTQIIPVVYKSFSLVSVRNLSQWGFHLPDSWIPAE